MTISTSYLRAVNSAYSKATADNYNVLLTGILCRLDVPNPHEIAFRRSGDCLENFKEQCKAILIEHSPKTNKTTS